jgi:uncharacterized membrane protein
MGNTKLNAPIKRVVVSAIFCALNVALMYIGSVTPLDYTAIMIASVTTAFAVIEFGKYYPFLIFAVTSVLSVLLLPNKETAFIYLLFAGYYPMCKSVFERYHYVVSWVLKVSLFNSSMLILITVSRYVLHIEATDFTFAVVFFLLANLTFILYDIAFTRILSLYIVKIRAKLKLPRLF